jgi:type I restriction enzyme M protein
LGNANLLLAKYMHLVCGSIEAAYDVEKHPSLKSLEKCRIADVPVSYGKAPSYKYAKGGVFDLKTVDFNELRRKFQACHDEIWEGGKRDPSESFDEMAGPPGSVTVPLASAVKVNVITVRAASSDTDKNWVHAPD